MGVIVGSWKDDGSYQKWSCGVPAGNIHAYAARRLPCR
jgi:hypothetical protein